MTYCKACVLPNTRPGIQIHDNGLCSGCTGHHQKLEVFDWPARAQEFEKIVAWAKAQKKDYDCLIPVSGGKDSTWQVVKCLEHGLKVLAVTWRTPGRTALGQKNLDNLISLGVDHIDFTINPEVERKFMLKALERTGSTGVPMHMAIYSIPLRLAVQMDIPLVIWGESPHMEYGGTQEERQASALNLQKHGILQGTNPLDWIGDGLTVEDMRVYRFPSDEELDSRPFQSIFLGHYFNWDPEESLRVASQNGFSSRAEGPRLGYYNYADIDCDFISVHHHFKWLKFGFTRLFDNLSLEIRNGRMSREKAVEIIRGRGEQRPHDDITRLCIFLKIPESRFIQIEESFRNHALWTRENDRWVIRNFLIQDWKW
ncbi:MAG: N-acetyl sugar amidotransferase [Candidatus Omnitrophica bacterium]|nr:N-acetyl sugar amidotransferase [Candidatus Omnitrophota bacterium]